MRRVKDYSLEEELELHKTMLGAQPQSMFLMDRNKIIIGIFNAAPETLAGFSVDNVVGKSILHFANDPESPFHQACTMLNSTFDPVFETGIPLKFQYMIEQTYLEATITKISGERILSQVRDITDIVLQINEIEKKKRNELAIALLAGGLTSWTYDVEADVISSTHNNNVIDSNMSLNQLLMQIDPAHRQMVITMFDDLISKKSEHGHVTVLTTTKRGEIQWSDVHAVPHEYADNGNVKLIIGSQKDVTKEYEDNTRLKQLNRQNELILNNNSSGLAYLTPDMRVEWENVSGVFNDKSFVQLFQVGSELQDATDSTATIVRKIIMEAFESKQTVLGKHVGLSNVQLELIAIPVFAEDGNIEGVVVRVDDITEKEEYLLQLAKAKERAEQSDRLKSAFLANMSHEIRTPLNAIVGFSQILPLIESKEEYGEYINIINSNTQTLLNLINDILDLSKIEAGYFTCNDSIFDLCRLLDELALTFRDKLQPGVELFVQVPESIFLVKLDRTRVSQIITNFLTNAIKFTTTGYIKMGFEISDKAVKIFIQDSGCGMTPDQTCRVFERFEKLESMAQGTGLGTSIAKAIVEAYNGQIGVESEVGVGSIFWALLPTNLEQNSVESNLFKEALQEFDSAENRSNEILPTQDFAF